MSQFLQGYLLGFGVGMASMILGSLFVEWWLPPPPFGVEFVKARDRARLSVITIARPRLGFSRPSRRYIALDIGRVRLCIPTRHGRQGGPA